MCVRGILDSLMALTLGACRALIGELDECRVSVDCDVRGAGLRCQDRLCVARPVLDSRCRWVGSGSGFVLASVLPVTRGDGTVNPTGVGREQAVILAVEELNAKGGVRGRALSLVACNSASSKDTAAELAAHVIDQGAVALFTSGSDETKEVAQRVTVPRGVVQVSVSATAPSISLLNDQGLVWRTSASDELQARVMAAVLVDAGVPATAIFHENRTYGTELAGSLYGRYTGRRELFPETSTDAGAQLDFANVFNPQHLVIIDFAEDVLRLLTQAELRPNLKGKPLFISDAARGPALLAQSQLLNRLEGARGTGPGTVDVNTEAFGWFTSQFKARFGYEPTTVAYAANAFDAVMCVFLSLWQNPNDPSGQTIVRGLKALHRGARVALIPTKLDALTAELDSVGTVDVDGVSGTLDFDDATGEPAAPIELWRIRNGVFEREALFVF